jgi:uncharacterized GH25 family protein
MKVRKQFLIFVLSVLWIFTVLPAAFAHKTVIEPDKYTVPQGGKVGFCWTYTEIIGTPEYSNEVTEDYVYGDSFIKSAIIRYKDVRSDITDNFQPYDSQTKKVVLDPSKSDSDYAEFTVAKNGTIVIEGTASGTNLYGDTNDYSYTKTFLNLTNDNTCTQAIGGTKFLEVVFAEDIAKGGPQVGDSVKFKLLLQGKPLPGGTEVFATYSGAPSYTIEEDGGEVKVNDYIIKHTDSNGEVEFIFDKEAGWFVGSFAFPEEGENYFGGVMFNVASKGSDGGGGGGGGGCSAGVGMFGIAALAVLAAALKRRFM